MKRNSGTAKAVTGEAMEEDHHTKRMEWFFFTWPLFLLLVPVAAAVSLFDRRDVFPAAFSWTHGILAFGHRWRAYTLYPAWQFCWCGAARVVRDPDPGSLVRREEDRESGQG